MSAAGAIAFETQRLLLRPLGDGDETFYCDIYGDAEILRHVGPPLTPERARRSFVAALRHTRAQAPREMFGVLARRGDGARFGLCGLRAIDLAARRAEAGILLAAPARGLGLAAEALGGLVARAFATLPLEEIYLDYAPQNAAMARLAHRVGFT
ncbi:MAG TPA: GNAT family N-acetyltransferase, partial [Tahibacter sp.]|uniref:GNAT family N-acetyltransferase n=1 Tax=Tahibacter sp. TaxID=2056211 RepID=UPI002BC0F692